MMSMSSVSGAIVAHISYGSRFSINSDSVKCDYSFTYIKSGYSRRKEDIIYTIQSNELERQPFFSFLGEFRIKQVN